MFLKKDTFSRSPKLRRSYKKECFELKEFLSKKHDIDVAQLIVLKRQQKKLTNTKLKIHSL